MGDRSKSRNIWSKTEVYVLGLLIFTVWALLSLPIIFFHLPVTNEVTSDVNTSNQGSSCPSKSQYLPVYSECFQELADVLSDLCSQDTTDGIQVVQTDYARIERRITVAKQGLLALGSESCMEAVVPLLCQYLFGLCSDSGYLLLPTSSQCENVKSSICQREWVLATQLGIGLPDCAALPLVTSCPSRQTNSTSAAAVNDSDVFMSQSLQNQTERQQLECSRGFYRDHESGVCHPSCHYWTSYDERLTLAIDVMVVFITLIGFFTAILVIVVSFLRRDKMLTYPSVLIVYMVSDILVMAFFVLISYIDRPGLFCTSENLVASLEHVTPFCIISGMMVTYVLIQLTIWWLFHTAIIFWKVIFPFHSRSFEKSGKMKYVHVICALAGIVGPFASIVASMGKFSVDVQKTSDESTSQAQLFLQGGMGYGLTRFPALLCTGTNKNVVFYSLVLPIDLALAVGCTLLLVIFWSVRKVTRENMKLKVKEDSQSPFKFGTAEKKLLVVFCYYVLLSSEALMAFTLSTKNASQHIRNIQLYFLCEQGGYNSSNPCSRDYLANSYPSVTALSYILLGLFPVVNLIYATNFQELKEALRKLKLKMK